MFGISKDLQAKMPLWLTRLEMSKFVSYTLMLAWLYVAYSSKTLFAAGQLPEVEGFPFGVSYLVVFASNSIALLVLALISSRIPANPRSRSALNIAAAVLVSFGTLGTAYASYLPVDGRPWLILASVVNGLGGAWLTLMCGLSVVGIGKRGAATAISLSYAIAIALYFVISSLPTTAAVIVTTVLPLFSAIILVLNAGQRVGSSAISPDSTPKFTAGRLGLFKLILGMAFFGFIFGLVRGLISGPTIASGSFDEINRILFIGGGAAAVLMSAASRFLENHQNLNIAYRFVLPLAAVGILIFPLLDNEQSALAAAIVMAAYVCFNIIIWVVFVFLAEMSDRALLICGWGLFASSTGVLAGSQASFFILTHPWPEVPMMQICIGIAFALIVVTTFVLNESSIFKELDTLYSKEASNEASVNTKPTSPIGVAGIDLTSVDVLITARSEQLAKKYLLTKKETEILFHLAKGRSLPYLQEVFFISKGTASSHTEHIYRKLNIHSRQELLDLFDK